jgi:hypothetical protein
LRALVRHLSPEVTPLTADERASLDALLANSEGPGAPCADSPLADPTRLEFVEAEAAARAAGDGPRARVAVLGLRAYRCYDRERDRVRELCAILEAAREALGCETWSGVPAEVRRLHAEVVEARERLREERATTDAQTDQRDELLRALVACRGERDEALAEAERLRAMVDRARELVAASCHTDDCAASHHQHCGAECDYDDSTPEECARTFREDCECGLRGLCDALGVEVSGG